MNDPKNGRAATAAMRTLDMHLASNAAACAHHNIVVHVDAINAGHNVAYCSVEQRRTGLLRKRLSVTQLVYQGEQAVAPLIGLGILPLLTVRHASLNNRSLPAPRSASFHLMRWMRDLWQWLGSPFAREHFGDDALAGDPFGWRKAMTNTV